MQLHSLTFNTAFTHTNDTVHANQDTVLDKNTSKQQNMYPNNTIPVYGDSPLRTKPAQLSLFATNDFHGQNIRMEKVCSISEDYDNDTFWKNNKMFDKNMPVDKLKFSSGDMFLGENDKETRVVNEFLNMIGTVATAIGNHECDTNINNFSELVKDKKYKFLGANMHPESSNKINSILSDSFVIEENGNTYGVIGLVPPDMANHMKRPEETIPFHISDFENSKKDVQNEINNLKKQGVNKIIVLSHMGYENDRMLAESVSDIDIILGGHTHNLLKDVKVGENLVASPKGEPVLIVQTGKEGNYIGLPNIKFNDLGQIEKVQYNVVNTNNFERSLIARNEFENVLGKPEIVGRSSYVEKPPQNFYVSENPHCDFILDCLKSELDTDIAIMNSANIRGTFPKGEIDTRDLRLISPFANNVTVTEITETELVNSIQNMIEKTSQASNHRPGILQVSGLKYEYSLSEGKLKSLIFIDKHGAEHNIDIDNPNSYKIYKMVSDDYCIKSSDAGMNLKHRLDSAIESYPYDKDKFVADYLKKQDSPIEIRSDGRIKVYE